MKTPEAYTISCVFEDWADLAATFYPLEREGFQLAAYETYYQAWSARVEIGNTNILVLDTQLPPGRKATKEILEMNPQHLGVRLLQELRTSGLRLPAIFWSIDYPPLNDQELKQLNATYVQLFVQPSVIRKHIHERLDLSLLR